MQKIASQSILHASVFITLLSFFYFWDLHFFQINIFYIVLFPLIFYLFKEKKVQFNKSFYLGFALFIILNLILFLISFDFNLNEIPKYKIVKFIGFFLVIFFSIIYLEDVIRQIKKLVLTFSLIYLVIIFTDFIVYFDTYDLKKILDFTVNKCSFEIGGFRKNYIFAENSHFGMIAVSLNLYLLYIASIQQKIFLRYLYIFICFIFLLNSSTTYFLGYFISSLSIIIAINKQLNKRFLIYICLFGIINLFPVLLDKSCSKRISDIKNVNKTIEDIKYNSNFDSENSEQFNSYLIKYYNSISKMYDETAKLEQDNLTEEQRIKLINKIESHRKIVIQFENKLNKIDKKRFKLTNENLVVNLTTQTYIRSLHIARESFKDNFFGWGFGNYDLSYIKYKHIIPTINPWTLNYHVRDASNNFAKIIVEYGIFGILLLIFLTISSLNSKVEPDLKCFFIPIIITQLIRGAGYFNGGFLISVVILIFLHFSRKYNIYK